MEIGGIANLRKQKSIFKLVVNMNFSVYMRTIDVMFVLIGVIYEMTEEEYDSLENLPNVKNLRLIARVVNRLWNSKILA